MKFFTKKGFTLAELLISVVIWTTVLLFVFSFVTDAIQWLWETNERTKILNQFYEFLTKMDNMKNTYVTGSLVYDQPSNAWYDVLMLTTYDETAWVLIGVVDAQNLKLVWNATYQNYGNKILWFRDLTATNISNINSTPSVVYDLQFFEDKVHRELVMKDFQAKYYNSWDILDLRMGIVLNYKGLLDGTPWGTIPQTENELFNVDLNF